MRRRYSTVAEILSGREQRNGLSRNALGRRVKIRREKNNPVNNRKNVLSQICRPEQDARNIGTVKMYCMRLLFILLCKWFVKSIIYICSY